MLYKFTSEGIAVDMLQGFFADWPNPPWGWP